MKLHELIVKLKEIEKSSPDAEVAFSLADIHRQSSRQIHPLDIESGGIGCRIVLGDYQGEEAGYKEWQENLRKQGRR